jgi:NAD(P)-dependent dehydrogenase (short-subunit alcohol dehydrogenase family)
MIFMTAGGQESQMAGLVQGKVALITGGASGIGRATALIFAREGAKVAVADLNLGGCEETVAMIKKAGGDAFSVKCDVSKTAQVREMVAQAVNTYGRLDCGFNNAGVSPAGGRIGEIPEDDWDRVIAINLTGVWLCMKYELAQMVGQGGGVIVNTASIMGLVGERRTGAYCAAKHGVVGLTKTAALEYAKRNIRVNAVCPGSTMTPMMQRGFERDPRLEEAYKTSHPLGRLGTPEDIGEAVMWMCSDEASFVTGLALPVDGGYTAH